MKRISLILIVVFIAMQLVSCAPGPNAAETGSDAAAGFWRGLWHGFIVLFTFIISLFNDGVNIYEVNNNGGWYNFGYLIGILCFGGGGGGGAARKRK